MKNANVQAMVKDFAKTNKIGYAKLDKLIASVLAEAVPVTGKPASPEVLKLREKLRKDFANKSTTVTVKQLASKYKADPVTMGNVVRYLANNEALFAVAGKEPRPAGMRGRAQLLWASNPAA